jgi:hypothetical protein
MRRGSAELIAGGGEHGIDGVAAWVCEVIATHAVMFLEMAELNSNKVLQIYKCFAEGSTSNLASCSIDSVENPMITLYSYPELFGVADNNGYGLKVFAFLRLNGMPFKHEHVFDASAAPRGQLPYIVDDGETIGDSDTIIAHVIAKNRLKIDAALTAGQRDMSLLITRMLDDLYWVMSYSRWKDERFWPAFRDASRSPPPHPAARASRGPIWRKRAAISHFSRQTWQRDLARPENREIPGVLERGAGLPSQRGIMFG